jgi:hypothetical protein
MDIWMQVSSIVMRQLKNQTEFCQNWSKMSCEACTQSHFWSDIWLRASSCLRSNE